MRPTILALDQSTSATKAVLFDAQGRVLDRAAREHRQIYPQPGWVEHDAEEIWQNVLLVAREMAGRNRNQLAQLAGVSLTNQRETILVFDRATGRPLHNAIVWLCRRSEPICQKLREQGHDEMVREKTGLKIDTYFSASKIKWLVAEKPGLASKLKNGEAVIGTMDAYLVHRLTGGKVFATDHTNASRTLLFDIARLRWDERLCELFDAPLSALPEVRESAAPFGETDLEGILPRRVPICGVMGDSQASLFAQRCFQPGMVKATFGTGTSVLLNIGDRFSLSGTGCQPAAAGNPPDEAGDKLSARTAKLPVPAKNAGAVTALAWVWRGQPTYAFEGIINFSAATISWLKDQLGLIQSSAEVETLAGAVPDNGGVYLVPAFSGLSAPYWRPDARAAIVGMTAHTRKEHIARAAEEAIAYQLRDVLDMMRADAQIHLQNLHADGGPTRDRFLMQFTADLTRMELNVSGAAENSAWGAAMKGLLGLGIYRSLKDLGALPREAQTYRPQMDPAQVKQLHDGWLAAVKRIL